MATNLIPIISIICILTMATQIPITPTSAEVLKSDQISYNSPPPPGECPYPCLPPPTSTSPNNPLPPPPPTRSGYYYPPGYGNYYPPPSGYYPSIPPPYFNLPAPPPPDPILPYFPFYYKKSLHGTSLSSPLHRNGATAFVILMLVCNLFCLM